MEANTEPARGTRSWVPFAIGAALAVTVVVLLVQFLDREIATDPALLARLENFEKLYGKGGQLLQAQDRRIDESAQGIGTLESQMAALEKSVHEATKREVPPQLAVRLKSLEQRTRDLSRSTENHEKVTELTESLSALEDQAYARIKAVNDALQLAVAETKRTDKAHRAELRELRKNTGSTGGDSFPQGTIVALAKGARIPPGWAECDGTKRTPDLRGRFPLGASRSYTAGKKGGSADLPPVTVKIQSVFSSAPGIDPDKPKAPYYSVAVKLEESKNYYLVKSPADATARFDPRANLPPYYAVTWIIKL